MRINFAIVLSTIAFDDETRSVAREIDYVVPERDLTAEACLWE